MSFRTGQRVVCISGRGWVTLGDLKKVAGPKEGDILTVRWHGVHSDMYALEFKELPYEYYIAEEFRPLDELDAQLDRIESEPKEEPCTA